MKRAEVGMWRVKYPQVIHLDLFSQEEINLIPATFQQLEPALTVILLFISALFDTQTS